MKDIYREYIGYISSRIYEEYERDSRGCGIWVYRVERLIGIQILLLVLLFNLKEITLTRLSFC